jgi:hypothetical protein
MKRKFSSVNVSRFVGGKTPAMLATASIWPPAAATAYIATMRQQLFGAGTEKYKVKPADASTKSWRKKNPMRMLIASDMML